MQPEELDKILEAVKEGAAKQVEISVNGKIEKLLKSHQELHEAFMIHMEEDKVTSKIIDDYIQSDNEYKDRKKEEDTLWRGEADKKLELIGNIQGFSKVFLWLLGFIVSVGAAVTVVIHFFKR